jgi:hypothetical protein
MKTFPANSRHRKGSLSLPTRRSTRPALPSYELAPWERPPTISRISKLFCRAQHAGRHDRRSHLTNSHLGSGGRVGRRQYHASQSSFASRNRPGDTLVVTSPTHHTNRTDSYRHTRHRFVRRLARTCSLASTVLGMQPTRVNMDDPTYRSPPSLTCAATA